MRRQVYLRVGHTNHEHGPRQLYAGSPICYIGNARRELHYIQFIMHGRGTIKRHRNDLRATAEVRRGGVGPVIGRYSVVVLMHL